MGKNLAKHLQNLSEFDGLILYTCRFNKNALGERFI